MGKYFVEFVKRPDGLRNCPERMLRLINKMAIKAERYASIEIPHLLDCARFSVSLSNSPVIE